MVELTVLGFWLHTLSVLVVGLVLGWAIFEAREAMVELRQRRALRAQIEAAREEELVGSSDWSEADEGWLGTWGIRP